eukprot:749273-Hanusia_phi.AAC.3
MLAHHLLRLPVHVHRLVALRRREERQDLAPRLSRWPSVCSQYLEGYFRGAEPFLVPHHHRVGGRRRRPLRYPVNVRVLVHRKSLGEGRTDVDPDADEVRLELPGLGLGLVLYPLPRKQEGIGEPAGGRRLRPDRFDPHERAKRDLPHALVRIGDFRLEHSCKLQPHVGAAVEPTWPSPHHCEARRRHGTSSDARDHSRLLVDVNAYRERGVDGEAGYGPPPAGDEMSLAGGRSLEVVDQDDLTLVEGELVAREGGGDVGVVEVMRRLKADYLHEDPRLACSSCIRRRHCHHPHSTCRRHARDLARGAFDGKAIWKVSGEEGGGGEAREEAGERAPGTHIYIAINLEDSLLWV